MTLEPKPRDLASSLELRARRADFLADRSESGREPLLFAAGLYRAEVPFAKAVFNCSLTGDPERDLVAFARELDGILSFAVDHAPEKLAGKAKERARLSADARVAWLAGWWRESRSGNTDYLARALLRSYGTTLFCQGVKPESLDRPEDKRAHCPHCGALPLMGVRSTSFEGEVALRFLVCSLCENIWPLARILCPSCGCGEPELLPGFCGETYKNMRIDACLKCMAYTKSIDIMIDKLVIPEVDDLEALAMDLWAIDQGYRRVEPGLAGL